MASESNKESPKGSIDPQGPSEPTHPPPDTATPSPKPSSQRSPSSRHRRVKHQAPPDCGFVINERIGKGSFAVVYKGEWGGDLLHNKEAVERTPPRQEVAIKVVQRSHLKREKRLMNIFEAEMDILKRMKHPHIVHLIDVVQTSTDYNLIMEYCSLGDLSMFIQKKKNLLRRNPVIADLFTQYPSNQEGLHPALVRHFLAQLACSLAFLRQHDIVHRDVKPQNLLLKPGPSSPEEAKKLGYAGKWNMPVMKIADFGFARFLPSTSMAETLCGSPLYMAPEILNYEKYNAKADLWSVGAVTYEMVTGKPPFPAANHMELIKKIDEGKDVISFPHAVDSDIEDIIRGLLRRSPSDRWSFEEFFRKTAWSETDSSIVIKSLELPTTLSSGSESVGSSKITESADAPGYSAHRQHRHDDDDIAVESESPSPESSQSFSAKFPHGVPEGAQFAKKSVDGSENDYVFIEKRAVEINSLADDLQTPKPSSHRITGTDRMPRRRRLSSIGYGASPTSALAQALLKSSARLFGGKSEGPIAQDPSPYSSATNATTGEKHLIDELEQLATIAKVVILFADVKFSQLNEDGTDSREEWDSRLDPSSSVSGRSCLYPVVSPSSNIDPYFQLTLGRESLALHLKALSILAHTMEKASEWWGTNGQVRQQTPNLSPAVNTLVQWVRDKFNECIERAESEKLLVAKLMKEISTDTLPQPDINAEKLLFDRALEMAKAAAVQEMAALSNSQDTSSEAISTCEMNYGTAVWMLKALMITDKPEEALSEDDRSMVDTLMGKIAQRLASLRRKASLIRSFSNSRMKSHSASPESPTSQRSPSILSRGTAAFPSQLTPP